MKVPLPLYCDQLSRVLADFSATAQRARLAEMWWTAHYLTPHLGFGLPVDCVAPKKASK
jgi:hypothetical protein